MGTNLKYCQFQLSRIEKQAGSEYLVLSTRKLIDPPQQALAINISSILIAVIDKLGKIHLFTFITKIILCSKSARSLMIIENHTADGTNNCSLLNYTCISIFCIDNFTVLLTIKECAERLKDEFVLFNIKYTGTCTPSQPMKIYVLRRLKIEQMSQCMCLEISQTKLWVSLTSETSHVLRISKHAFSFGIFIGYNQTGKKIKNKNGRFGQHVCAVKLTQFDRTLII